VAQGAAGLCAEAPTCKGRNAHIGTQDIVVPGYGLARSVIVLKRSMNSGFDGIDNPLFYAEGTTMLFGDAKKSVTEVAEELKAL
jgi:NAD/NADP transhydrogenase beta subunit